MTDMRNNMRRREKSPDAFRTISEVADDLEVPAHVLRFWETKFNQIKPLKRGGGRRYYRPEDVDLLRQIRGLLYVDGYTIKGVQKLLKEGGGLRNATTVLKRVDGSGGGISKRNIIKKADRMPAGGKDDKTPVSPSQGGLPLDVPESKKDAPAAGDRDVLNDILGELEELRDLIAKHRSERS